MSEERRHQLEESTARAVCVVVGTNESTHAFKYLWEKAIENNTCMEPHQSVQSVVESRIKIKQIKRECPTEVEDPMSFFSIWFSVTKRHYSPWTIWHLWLSKLMGKRLKQVASLTSDDKGVWIKSYKDNSNVKSLGFDQIEISTFIRKILLRIPTGDVTA